MKFIRMLVVVLLAWIGSVSLAGDYTFSNGYYWRDGVAYERYRVKVWINDCYYRWEWRYRPVKITVETKNWRTKLLELAEARDKAEAARRKSMLESEQFLRAVQELGLSGNFRWENYGQFPGYYGAYGQQQQAYYQQATPQGATIYGYSTIADVYGDVDVGALYSQAIRLASDANKYAGDATKGAQQLVAQEGEYRARVAEILAKAQAASQLMDAVKPTTHAKIETRSWQAKSGSGVVAAPSQPSAGSALSNLIDRKCVKCHGPAKQEGNLRLDDLSRLTPQQGARILEVIVSTDPETRMPPNEPLSPQEISLFYQAARAVR